VVERPSEHGDGGRVRAHRLRPLRLIEVVRDSLGSVRGRMSSIRRRQDCKTCAIRAVGQRGREACRTART
jgi:hypothetical protein